MTKLKPHPDHVLAKLGMIYRDYGGLSEIYIDKFFKDLERPIEDIVVGSGFPTRFKCDLQMIVDLAYISGRNNHDLELQAYINDFLQDIKQEFTLRWKPDELLRYPAFFGVRDDLKEKTNG